MGLHESLKAIDQSTASVAIDLAINPNMPISKNDSVTLINSYPVLRDILGALTNHYVEVAMSSAEGDEEARMMIVGSIVALNVVARCAELETLQLSFEQ